MPLSERDIATFEGGRVRELRPTPVRVRVDLGQAVARDGHQISGAFTCSVQPVDRPADRAMLEEVFGPRGTTVSAQSIADHLASSLRATTTEQIAKERGDHWLGATGRGDLIAALQRSTEAVAFSSGLQVLPPFDLHIESPTLEKLRVQELERQLHERSRASHAEQLQRAADVLRQFRELREAAPDLPAGRLLEQFSAADRGAMLQTVLMASSETGSAPLFAAAGTSLVRIIPGDGGSQQIVELPDAVGPFRSVQPCHASGRRRLLIGARAGVLCVDPDEPANAIAYHTGGGTSSALGFNSVVRWRDRLYASHGEAGIVAWDVEEPNESILAIPPDGNGGPRSLEALDDGRLIYAAGRSLMMLRDERGPEMVYTAPAAIVRAVVTQEVIALACADGTVVTLDRRTLKPSGQARRSGSIAEVGTLSWLGDQRLLLATEDGPVCCIGLDDSLVTQYTSPHRGLKAIAATTSTIAGISPDRQRLVLWNSWRPDAPSELHISSLARHRLADLCFA